MLSSKPKNCSSTQLEVIDDLHREEIDLLNEFMKVLPNSDDEQIDDWIQRLERQVLHHFNEEEACMKRVMCPNFKKHVEAHSETLKAIKEAKKTGRRSEIYCNFGTFLNMTTWLGSNTMCEILIFQLQNLSAGMRKRSSVFCC